MSTDKRSKEFVWMELERAAVVAHLRRRAQEHKMASEANLISAHPYPCQALLNTYRATLELADEIEAGVHARPGKESGHD
jgi:hypothetical protein